MPQEAAPEYGVRHGDHPGKAGPAQPFPLPFLTAVAASLDPADPADGRTVEGDVITPALPRAAPDDRPAGSPPEVYERTAAPARERSAALRTACERSGQIHADTGQNHEEALELAYDFLTRHP
ncbi:hypothetical protein ABZ714_26140 [Streptomyces sp. NPDC006798]|uniref:hypothetical protein n=1 Tax=Streptomyces sp. NPDC006798 TaxID=3155462 RepID=UPI003405CE7E